MFPAPLPALLLALASPFLRAPDEFHERFAALASPHAAERAAAERWLEANLVFERYAELAEAALAGDAEVRGRLVNVLGSDARLLALALELCREKQPALAELGREAVRVGVAHADPHLGVPGLRDRQGLEGLRDRQGLEMLLHEVATRSPPRAVRVDGRLSLEEMCAELELAGELPIGIALDARVATKRIRRDKDAVSDELASGPWDELVLRLARSVGAVVELHGIVPARASDVPSGAFLVLTSDQDPVRTGAERLTEWLLTLAGDAGNEAARVRAACNLASSDFAPALEWMDRLVTRGDRAALEGALRAAALGRVAPALASAGVLDGLLAEAEAGPGSARILCALAHLGCFDARGAPLAPRLVAGFAALAPRAQWSRLFVLEKNGCAARELEAPVRARLADPATPAALRLRALAFLCASTDLASAPKVAALDGLFRLGLDEDELERLARMLALARLEPPWRDPAAIPADASARERLDVLQAWLWQGDEEPAAAHVAAWLAGAAPSALERGDALAEELRPWLARGARPRLAAVLMRARSLAPARARDVDRVRLLLGLVPGPDVPGLLATQRFALAGADADLMLLGALAGALVPIAPELAAREQLNAQLAAALAEDRPLARSRVLAAALERAAQGLYAAGRESEAEAFVVAVTKVAGRYPKSELARALVRPAWPGVPGAKVRDLARELAHCELPSM